MQTIRTSLPQHVSPAIKEGRCLAGDDYTDEQLVRWFAEEQEAFYEGDAGNSEEDPWYTYMRHVNEVLGFSVVAKERKAPTAMLVLGPGSGKEVVAFATANPTCKLNFLEASENFKVQLRQRFPGSAVIAPRHTGEIDLPDATQDVVCAFSVLHHIPNVSKVLAEVGRVTRPGGLLMVREPCSSMGDWRHPRSTTPNERGISRRLLVQMASRAGFSAERTPVPIILEPINKLLKRTIGFDKIAFTALYRVDRVLSALLSVNDHYWRDSWLKKLGPSSYFYVFRRQRP